jgi:hypothetical protein
MFWKCPTTFRFSLYRKTRGWTLWEIHIKTILSGTSSSIKNQTLMKKSLDGPLPKWCPAVDVLKVSNNFQIFVVQKNQRLPGAWNRSPGSKLLSITTQLHCGDHLGGRAQLWTAATWQGVV